MVDDFEVKTVYEDRTYERHQFSFVLDGKEYKGDYHEDEIQWLNPHPKQDLSDKQLERIEAEVRRLLSKNEVITNDDLDEIEVRKILEDHSRNAHLLKITIDGEEFQALLHEGNLEWFHPKPERKLEEEQVKEVEEMVQEKVKQHLNEES